MSNNVIDFPSSEKILWGKYKKKLKEDLINSSMPENDAEEFLDTFKPIFENFQFSHSFSFTVSGDAVEAFKDQIKNLSSMFREHTQKLIAERYERELEIYLKNK